MSHLAASLALWEFMDLIAERKLLVYD